MLGIWFIIASRMDLVLAKMLYDSRRVLIIKGSYRCVRHYCLIGGSVLQESFQRLRLSIIFCLGCFLSQIKKINRFTVNVFTKVLKSVNHNRILAPVNVSLWSIGVLFEKVSRHYIIFRIAFCLTEAATGLVLQEKVLLEI